jgi:hypothetical protein
VPYRAAKSTGCEFRGFQGQGVRFKLISADLPIALVY